jgi:hypothetical protein
MPMAETAQFVVSRMDLTLLLAELRDHPSDPLYSPLLEALLTAAQRLDAGAPSQGASETKIHLIIPAEHAEPFKFWLLRASVRASQASEDSKAVAFKRIRESMR